jgi:hypothetical protein
MSSGGIVNTDAACWTAEPLWNTNGVNTTLHHQHPPKHKHKHAQGKQIPKMHEEKRKEETSERKGGRRNTHLYGFGVTIAALHMSQ